MIISRSMRIRQKLRRFSRSPIPRVYCLGEIIENGVPRYRHCYVTTPWGMSFAVRGGSPARFSKLSDCCAYGLDPDAYRYRNETICLRCGRTQNWDRLGHAPSLPYTELEVTQLQSWFPLYFESNSTVEERLATELERIVLQSLSVDRNEIADLTQQLRQLTAVTFE